MTGTVLGLKFVVRMHAYVQFKLMPKFGSYMTVQCGLVQKSVQNQECAELRHSESIRVHMDMLMHRRN